MHLEPQSWIGLKNYLITSITPHLLDKLGYREDEELLGRDIRCFFHLDGDSDVTHKPARTFRLHALDSREQKQTFPALLLGHEEQQFLFIGKPEVESHENSDPPFHALFNSAFDYSPVGMALFDLGGSLLRTNQQLTNITGYSFEDISDMYFAELIKPVEERNEALFQLLSVSDQKPERSQVLEVNGKYGQTLQLKALQSVVYDEENQPVFYLKSIQDVTEIKASELRIRRMAKEFDNFVYRASHDLQGPLSTIEGLSDLLRMHDSSPATVKYADMISKVSLKMKKALLGMLEASRINDLQSESEPIDFRDLIDNILNELLKLYDLSEINIHTHIDRGVAFESDPALVTIVIKNLLENAVVFRDHKRACLIKLSIRKSSEKNICIELTDNGVGIAEEDREDVFRMFCRKSPLSRGSGIGLYLIKQTVDRLNGRIEMQSQRNQGSTFRVYL